MSDNHVAVVEIPKGSSNKYEWDDELETPEWKVVKVDGWYSRDEALESIERARKRWRAARS
jgi:inorganic pyrophosphatase